MALVFVLEIHRRSGQEGSEVIDFILPLNLFLSNRFEKTDAAIVSQKDVQIILFQLSNSKNRFFEPALKQ